MCENEYMAGFARERKHNLNGVYSEAIALSIGLPTECDSSNFRCLVIRKCLPHGLKKALKYKTSDETNIILAVEANDEMDGSARVVMQVGDRSWLFSISSEIGEKMGDSIDEERSLRLFKKIGKEGNWNNVNVPEWKIFNIYIDVINFAYGGFTDERKGSLVCRTCAAQEDRLPGAVI